MPVDRWKPSVTVAAIIEHDGRYLVVEEQTSEGLRLNNPAGHLDPGESPLQGVVREVLEETTRAFTPVAVLGVYLSRVVRPDSGDDITYLRLAFAGDVGAPDAALSLDEGIVRTLWLTPDELRAQRHRHRSPLLMRCIDDHARGRRFALDLIAVDASVYHHLANQESVMSPAAQPNIAQKAPFAVNVEAGKDYFWCACGYSRNQPFCDGSHKDAAKTGGGFAPVKYSATQSQTVWMCGCKRSANKPMCDGTHKTL